MRNIVNNHRELQEKPFKSLFNLRVEKLVREANDNFIYYRDYETALEQVNEALVIEPCHTRALILKGDILLSVDKDKEALEYFDKAINADPYSAHAYGSKAGTLDILGNQQDALYCCEKALENVTIKDRELLPSLYDQKIAILVRLKKFEEARLTLKKCVRALSEEDGSYLVSCYQNMVDVSCKEKQRKREMVEKISLRLVYS